MFNTEISHEEVNALPLLRFEGKTFVISNNKGLYNTFDEINRASFVGFDTETKPNFIKGRSNSVALIQIALEKKVFLIRINKTGLVNEICSFFESGVCKIGIALHDDIKALRQVKMFDPREFINLNVLTAEMGIKNQGIRKLAGIILEGRVSKSQQLSNWENERLTGSQINYAATDAWVCWKMYAKLQKEGYV